MLALLLLTRMEQNGLGTNGNGGLAAFDGANWTLYNASNSGIPEGNIAEVVIDDDGIGWMGIYFGGLLDLFDGTSWVIFNTSNSGISSTYIRSISNRYSWFKNGYHMMDMESSVHSWPVYRIGLNIQLAYKL